MGAAIAWRVQGGRDIVLEHLLCGALLRVALPSLLSCTPVVRAGDLPSRVELLVAFQTQSGCEVALIGATFPRSGDRVQVESLQGAVDDDIVTALHEEHGAFFFGLATGTCGRVVPNRAPQPALEMVRFERADFPLDDNDTSMTSDSSRRSASASTASQSFITRLFKTPRHIRAPPSAHSPSSAVGFETPDHRTARDSIMSLATPRSSRRPTITGIAHGDATEALCSVQLHEFCLIALHASGHVCAYLRNGERFILAGDTKLGHALAKDYSTQFLLRASHEHIVAVVTVDEDPQANSLRVFSIKLKFHDMRTVTVECRQDVKLSGPIDRLVGAVLLGNDVIVGTETGIISGPLKSNEVDNNCTGLPACELWTSIHDIEMPNGYGHVLNSMIKDPRDRLLAAHRFSPNVIAKALRFHDMRNVTREGIEEQILESNCSEDDVAVFREAISRAEFLCIDTDMPLRSIQIVDGVGLVASRNVGLFVFRKLHQEEHNALGGNFASFREADMLSGTVACLASSHGISQILCSALSCLMESDPSYNNMLFMMRQSLGFSEVKKHIPLTYCFVQNRAVLTTIAQNLASPSDILFGKAVDYVRGVLEPGARSLRYLFDAGEIRAFHRCAMEAGSLVPVSSFFACGLAWLTRYKRLKNEQSFGDGNATENGGVVSNVDLLHVAPSGTNEMDYDGMIRHSYGNLVSAAQVASSTDGLADEDKDCVLHLAKIISTSPHQDGWGAVPHSDKVDPALYGVTKEEIIPHLGYWLLERSVRLFESAGSPKTAAAAALEAMKMAPTQAYYETMRSAAFGRFLDARELQTALNTQLKPPFDSESQIVVDRKEASALRDGIGLFVNAVADEGRLQWLAEVYLPEPLNSLASLTLERRARAAEPLDANAELEAMEWSDTKKEFRQNYCYEYEYLYAWHMKNFNATSAAASVLEWGERLSTEGLSIVVSTTFDDSRFQISHPRLLLFLAWATVKVRAFSGALSVVQTMDTKKRYFARSKFSVRTQDPQQESSGIVRPDWVARRELLAHAQRNCITRMLSETDKQRVVSLLNFLMAHGSQHLQDTAQGVRWISNRLYEAPITDNIQLSVELAATWIEEIGDAPLISVVSMAAKIAANVAVKTFNYSHFKDLLVDVYRAGLEANINRNWGLIGLKSALKQSAGELQIPQWLIEQALWGLPQCNGPNSASNGYVGAVVRAFLEVSRPINAAKVILAEFRRFSAMKEKSERVLHYYSKQTIPYAAIDATRIMLGRMDENNKLADLYLKQLKEATRKYSSMAVGEYKNALVRHTMNQDSPVMVSPKTLIS